MKLENPKLWSLPVIAEMQDPLNSTWVSIIARQLHCEKNSSCLQDGFDSTQTCRACKKVLSGFHPDWIGLDAPFEVKEVRSALARLRQKPFESSFRLFTLRGFDSANDHVQNSLLKTLEEPEDSWRMAVTVSSRYRVLPTIRSRCFVFQPEPMLVQTKTLNAALFDAIANRDELTLFQELEPHLQDRHKALEIFRQLLAEASQQGYPDFWKNLAPCLEESLRFIDERHLTARVVWDRAWSRAEFEGVL